MIASSQRLRLAAACCAFLLGACTSAPPLPTDPLDGTAWILTELPGQSLEPDAQITLRFAERRLGGSDGCNRYGGGYVARGAELLLAEDLASTQMACPEPVMRQAAAYLAALQRASSTRVTEASLELLDASGTLVARYTAQPRDLAGTRWQIVAVNNGRQATASVLPGSSLTLEFGTDGRASGSAGCNRYFAGYTQTGTALDFSAPAATKRYCAEPPGVMAQEAALLAALETVAVARREGNRLELRTEEGALALALRATAASSTGGPATVSSPPQAPDFPAALPTTFRGDLPCADCTGIRHHLDLWPDQVFHLRREWLGRDLVRDELGHWRFDGSRGALVLEHSAEMPLQFELLEDGRLRQLDLEGRHIESRLPYELEDVGKLTPTELHLLLAGELTYLADAARFTECITGRSYPVAFEADFVQLERAYVAQASAPGAPLYVSFEGSLVDRPEQDGPGTATTVVVRRFVAAWPEQRCTR
jgi:heat shock protein HslJ/uncharacterized lipoprotein NlpE involved in copper resistance